MKGWEERARDSLKKSLYPMPQEPNELGWKSRLSDHSSRLAQHLSAFANQQIDELAAEIWGPRKEELKDIKKSLEEMR
jgi:hypothetical protein